MRILFVGDLAWNPERICSLLDRGHELYGLWTRSMAWAQGPYPFARGRVRDVGLADAGQLLARGDVDVVYSAFMSYGPSSWDRRGRRLPELWHALRTVADARDRSAPHVPIVRHWGSDHWTVDQAVVDRLDGHIFCNRQMHAYLAAPRAEGGAGIEVGVEGDRIAYLDSDLPTTAFMNDRFSTKLSELDGEVHTACVGDSTKVDFLALARRGIHVHLYGNDVVPDRLGIGHRLGRGDLREARRLMRRFVHLHRPRQALTHTMDEIRSVKESWVEEFSRYDAGWSYVDADRWPEIRDRAMIPNRLGTYMLSGLPIIAEVLPGYHRYEVVHERGVGIEFRPGDYDELAEKLRDRGAMEAAATAARQARFGYSFEATIDPLISFLEHVRTARAGAPAPARTVRSSEDGPGAPGLARRAVRSVRRARRRLRRRAKAAALSAKGRYVTLGRVRSGTRT